MRLIKIRYIIVTALLFITLNFSCSNKQKSEKKEITIGFCMDDLVQLRWHKDRAQFVKKAMGLGTNVMVRIAQGDDMKQFNQAKELIKQGVDVLVVVPVNLETAAAIVKAAHKAGIKVISYDRLIKNADLDYYISFDNVKVGELQAQYMVKLIPKGRYILIGGSINDNNSYLLQLGQKTILQPYIERGDIEIVLDQYVDEWEAIEGYKIMKTFLEKNKEADAVLAGNDALAGGVIKALKEYNLEGKIAVSGQDADVEACRRIIRGTQTMTVYKPINALAVTAAKIAVKLAKDQPVVNTNFTINNGEKLVPATLLPSQVVNKETIKLTVIEDEYWTKKQIYGNDSSAIQ